MHIVMTSSDELLFDASSDAYKRMVFYATSVETISVIVRTCNPKIQSLLNQQVRIFPSYGKNKLQALWNIQHVIVEHCATMPIDWISAQDPFEQGYIALRVARKCGARMQAQIHTDIGSNYFKKASLFNRIRLYIAGYVLQHADRVRVVSKRIEQALIDDFNVPPKKISVLPVYTNSAAYVSKSRTDFLKKKYPQFKKTILMVSRLTAEKDIISALRAFALVRARESEAGLVILGSGPELSVLRMEAKKLNIEHCVVFEGYVSDTACYFASANVFLFTSLYEGYARVLVEAALAGLPIVTTDVGLIGDILAKDDVTLVYKQSPTDIARGVMAALSETREQTATGKRIKVAQLLDEQTYINQFAFLWK